MNKGCLDDQCSSSALNYLKFGAMEKALIPYIVACFQPNDTVIYFDTKKDPYERMIFDTEEGYREFEQQGLRELDKLISESEHCKEINYFFNNSNKLRFLQGGHYDYKGTLKSIIEHISYIKHRYSHSLNDREIEYLNRGIYYTTGRDKCFRPIGVLKVDILTKIIQQANEDPYEELLNATIYSLSYIVKYMMIPGKVENIVNIIDVIDVSPTKIPIKQVIKIIGVVQKHYKCRVQKALCIGVGFGIKLIWKIISPFVDYKLREKVTLFGEKENNRLTEFIHPSQLEKRFGGLMENLTEFWPPKLGNSEYGYDPSLINFEDNDVKLAQMKNKVIEYQRNYEYNIGRRNLESLEGNETGDNCHIIRNSEGKIEIVKPSCEIDFTEIIELQNHQKIRNLSSETQCSDLCDKERCCCSIF